MALSTSGTESTDLLETFNRSIEFSNKLLIPVALSFFVVKIVRWDSQSKLLHNMLEISGNTL